MQHTVEGMVERWKKKKAGKKRKDPDAALKAMVAKNKTTMESIYFLYVDDEDEWPIYIGRTKQTLKARLSKHLSESKTGKSKKCKALRALQEEGFTINIGLIDKWPTGEAGQAEDLAIVNARGQGLMLLNSIAAPVDDYIVDIDENHVKFDWANADFKDGWAKGHGKCKGNEWHKEIGGVDWFRIGWSRLRMDHPVYGSWQADGMVFEICVRNAIAYFTPGTPQRQRLIDHMKKKA